MARLDAFAKINLSLQVLYKRPDDYHELRTIFQTISLADHLEIAFTPGRKSSVDIDEIPEIPNNLIARAAELCLDAMGATGRVEFRLRKTIPMGAGLGGGSSDAAAVLLALPVLAGKRLDLATLLKLAAGLGSDVPFFLFGGAALGIGRGAEIYPLPDSAPRHGLLTAPGIHVSTARAYRDLTSTLTMESQQNKMVSFQSKVWRTGVERAGTGDPGAGENDFEAVVFAQYPQLNSLKHRLLKMGAQTAMMTGSGSAIFGLFGARAEAVRAMKGFGREKVFLFSLVSRARYRSVWRRRLAAHITEERNIWPPQSRYAR